MRFVSYLDLPLEAGHPRIKLGALGNQDCVIDLAVAQTWAQGVRGFRARDIPTSMLDLLRQWEDAIPHLHDLLEVLPETEDCLHIKGAGRRPAARSRAEVVLLPPLPNVLSLRCFDAFEAHVRSIYRLQSKAVPKAWFERPVFHYGNPFTIQGPEQALIIPRQSTALDYSLEIACFIGRQGRDISPEQAADHIAGYTIMNNWALRDVQKREMEAGLGPAKGKDFATTFGPALVTADELAAYASGDGPDQRLDLTMTAEINGVERSRGSFQDIRWTFAEMIAYASQDVALYPGEMLSSGTVGTGCLLEQGAEDSGEWLKPGDQIVLKVEGLGRLETAILAGE